MKKLTALLLALVLVFAMAACAANTDQTPPADTSANTQDNAEQPAQTEKTDAPSEQTGESHEPVTIRFAWWGSQTRNDQTLAVVELFQMTYPWITVECEYVGWSDYWDTLSVEVASGEMPDVVQHDYRYLETYVNKGLLYPLDEFLGSTIDMSAINESVLSGGTVDGKVYGIPLGMNCFNLIYNETLFEENGIETPKYGWSYEDYLNTAEQFKQKGLYACDLTNFEDIVLFQLREAGVSLYNQNGVGLGYDDDALMEEIFQKRLDQVEAGYLPTPDIANQASGTEDSLIVRKQAAMVTYWSNAAASVANPMEDTIKVTSFFGDCDKGTYIKPSMFASISARTEHPDEAALLIDFITNNVDANKIMMAERGVPISQTIRDAIADDLDVTAQSVFDLVAYMTEHAAPIDKPDPEGAGEVVELLQELEEQLLYKQITPAEAAALFRVQATEILEGKA